MGCACGSGGASKLYNIEVTLADGTKRVYATKAEARIAISVSGQTGTMKQVLKASNPVSK